MSLYRMRTFFIKRPILTNTIVFAGLYSAGDISVQTFITKNEKYDWKSTARIALVAACYFGPVYPPYYAWLERFWPGTKPSALAKKLLFDQGVMGFIGSVVFFAGTSFLEGKGKVWEETKDKAPKAYLGSDLRSECLSTVNHTYHWWWRMGSNCSCKCSKVGFAYWPLAQLINFRYMPTYLRSAYVAVAAFAWTNFLCYLKHKSIQSHPESEKVSNEAVV